MRCRGPYDAGGHPAARPQISTDQCDLLGLTNEVYARTHTAFLLAKLAVEF